MKDKDIEPFFATLKAANPMPQSELEYSTIFELLVAVFLVLLPVVGRRASSASQDRLAQIVLTVGAALAFLILMGGVLAVPAQLHLLHLQKQPTSTAMVSA